MPLWWYTFVFFKKWDGRTLGILEEFSMFLLFFHSHDINFRWGAQFSFSGKWPEQRETSECPSCGTYFSELPTIEGGNLIIIWESLPDMFQCFQTKPRWFFVKLWNIVLSWGGEVRVKPTLAYISLDILDSLANLPPPVQSFAGQLAWCLGLLARL